MGETHTDQPIKLRMQHVEVVVDDGDGSPQREEFFRVSLLEYAAHGPCSTVTFRNMQLYGDRFTGTAGAYRVLGEVNGPTAIEVSLIGHLFCEDSGADLHPVTRRKPPRSGFGPAGRRLG